MSKVLKKWSFKKFGGGEKLPWDEWTDGKIYKLVQGEDFDTKFASLRGAAYREAKKRGMTVRTEVLLDEKAVVIQFEEE